MRVANASRNDLPRAGSALITDFELWNRTFEDVGECRHHFPLPQQAPAARSERSLGPFEGLRRRSAENVGREAAPLLLHAAPGLSDHHDSTEAGLRHGVLGEGPAAQLRKARGLRGHHGLRAPGEGLRQGAAAREAGVRGAF